MKTAIVLAWILGIYLTSPGSGEPFVIDMSDSFDPRPRLGGPSLAGVLAIHHSRGSPGGGLTPSG